MASFSAKQRGFPWPGLLLIVLGVGLFVVYNNTPFLRRVWSPFARGLFFAIVICLILAGVGHILTRFLPERPKRSITTFNRTRFQIPREGLTYLLIMGVLFVGSLLGHSNMLMLVFALMVGPFLLNGGAAFTMLKGISVERRTPRRAMAGEVFSVELALKNHRRLLSAWVMSARDVVDSPQEQLTPGVLFTRVPPRGTVSGHYHLQLMQRGRYELGPVQVSTRFPLGLVERGLLFAMPGDILIYPRIGRLASGWIKELTAATELVQQPRSRIGIFDDEFHRLREYRPGDNPKAIHWRTSARRNELILREFHQNREHNLGVVVDLWQPEKPSAEDLERIELAVSFAASVCLEHFRNSRDSVLQIVACGAATERWEGHAAPASTENVLDFFALVQGGRASQSAESLQDLLASGAADTRILLITTRPLEGKRLPAEFTTQNRASEMTHRLQVVEADPRLLETVFLLDDHVPPSRAQAAPTTNGQTERSTYVDQLR